MFCPSLEDGDQVIDLLKNQVHDSCYTHTVIVFFFFTYSLFQSTVGSACDETRIWPCGLLITNHNTSMEIVTDTGMTDATYDICPMTVHFDRNRWPSTMWNGWMDDCDVNTLLRRPWIVTPALQRPYRVYQVHQITRTRISDCVNVCIGVWLSHV